MIIGSEFSEKYYRHLKVIGNLSDEDVSKNIPVQDINAKLKLSRAEIKNILEYFEGLGYIEIVSIGGPLLYGHIRIKEAGLQKYRELRK